MEFKLVSDDILRQTTLEGIPNSYDGYPIPGQLFLEWVPRTYPSADRLTVAGALAFFPYISGRLELERPVTKLVADRLQLFFGDANVSVTNVELRNREPERGTTAFLLGVAGGFIPRTQFNGFDEPRQLALVDFRSTERSGASFEFDRLSVPSNCWLMREGLEISDISYWFSQIAYAILMAKEFEVGEIWIPNIVKKNNLLENLVELLKSVDIGVNFSEQ